ncbi:MULTISPECIES: high light inducible protein [Prochlorococcus]|uniref:High light inducible protein hli9 n=1 Tax=Prochlorococcus marinus (strain SARG / CCMP1375 / SS120) TaxID=167539 RepID=Q7VDB4_PROMA|nr:MULTISPECIES: high light inducible protein [Prochlorococcus]AAP99514.1 High light inducible protein hli9 [Prochlorococcus marinus subsp. marinus str. CCMP1375]KGG11214.1 putative high light inducible protein [Prochlorococcus marinus str. LG]KGG21552.1 putative high light inducible protein [Prochlorococcus marinus str. SS2]KGG23105.1 putative high light inducible protein [Prochlorococcus marinus str. SS35]KGG33815.1 putative high light inducible protein [Prochlorococcus marinus str. SS51]
MNSQSTNKEKKESTQSVEKSELNAWKRGFTPQAEIWNGRMASIGLILGLIVLILINKFYG